MASNSVIVAVFAMVISLVQSQNLLQNADMESTNYNGNWYGMGCTISPSNDAFLGQHSIHVSSRTQDWNGVAQNVNLQGGSVYKITAYVKLLGTAGNALYQTVVQMLACKDPSEKEQYISIGTTPRVLPSTWYQVGGVALIQNGYHNCHVYIETTAPAEYLVDAAEVVLVPQDDHWKEKANARIDNLRKADINIQLAGNNVDTVTVDVELKQTKMEFPFGSAVDARKIVDSVNIAYQQAFYNNFEWGVVENDLKWNGMERRQGHIDYATPITAIDAMRSHGITVRCHCAFWDVDKDGQVQDWVKALSVENLKTAIHQRIQGVINTTKGKCEQWDVNNENLHGNFYESHTHDPHVTEAMFREVHAIDNHPALFLNDYEVLSIEGSTVTVALKDLALKYKAAGVPISGIGAQGHLHNFDIRLLKAKLDILQEAGLPVMITELGINHQNEQTRAHHLTDTLTLMFSHPAVQGIIFWGFWDGRIWEQKAPLFNGPNVTANAAGKAYQQLFHSTWRTHETHSVHSNNVVRVKGFKGTYQMNVKHNGLVIEQKSFTLGHSGQSVKIHINGTSGGVPAVSHIVVG